MSIEKVIEATELLDIALDAQSRAIYAAYESGARVRDIGEAAGLHTTAIFRRLEKAGVSLRTRGRPKKVDG